MNKVPKELLQAQYAQVTKEIETKEAELKGFNPTTFVLNKDMSKIIEELKNLNSQRAEIASMLEEMEG